MKIIHKVIVVIVLGLFLAGLPSSLPAQTPPKESPKEIVALLKEQSNKLSNDLRRIHREIAALRVGSRQAGYQRRFRRYRLHLRSVRGSRFCRFAP